MEHLTRVSAPFQHAAFKVARGLSTHTGQVKTATYTPSQMNALYISSIITSGISMVMSALTFYWFIRMKRSFRHLLILILILSDACKSFLYVLFAIVHYAGYKVPTDSDFCQAQGFFLQFSVSVSDFSILVIAIHSAWYVFNPPHELGQGGLYPYRWVVYPLWFSLPVITASLGFTNAHARGYINAGTFCYLPKRPFWYRLALAWIPRYIIFFIILILFTAIYVYVHRKFKGFENLSLGASGPSSDDDHLASPSNSTMEHKNSIFTPFNMQKSDQHAVPTSPDDRPEWERVDFITTSMSSPTATNGVVTTDFALKKSVDHSKQRNAPGSVANSTSGSGDNLRRDDGSAATFPGSDTSATETTLVPSPPAAGTIPSLPSDMALSRLAIRRQLKFMFIYPVLYILMWMFPFVNHCLQYSDYFVLHPPYWLNLISILSTSLQAAVDAFVFSWKERPWRRLRHRPRRSSHRGSWWGGSMLTTQRSSVAKVSETPIGDQPRRKTLVHWWEREGRMRGDSIISVPDLCKLPSRESNV